jgi:hypothetical protein
MSKMVGKGELVEYFLSQELMDYTSESVDLKLS